MGTAFYVQAEMYICDDYRQFCVLECLSCRQKKRTREAREFYCAKCKKLTKLVPRCLFQVDLIDGTGSTTAYVSGDLGEKMLCMTASEIFDTTCVKHLLLPIQKAHTMLSERVFLIKLRKGTWKESSVSEPALTVMSYTEKPGVLPLTLTDRVPKKARIDTACSSNSADETAVVGSSTVSTHIGPLTPAKKV